MYTAENGVGEIAIDSNEYKDVEDESKDNVDAVHNEDIKGGEPNYIVDVDIYRKKGKTLMKLKLSNSKCIDYLLDEEMINKLKAEINE